MENQTFTVVPPIGWNSPLDSKYKGSRIKVLLNCWFSRGVYQIQSSVRLYANQYGDPRSIPMTSEDICIHEMAHAVLCGGNLDDMPQDWGAFRNRVGDMLCDRTNGTAGLTYYDIPRHREIERKQRVSGVKSQIDCLSGPKENNRIIRKFYHQEVLALAVHERLERRTLARMGKGGWLRYTRVKSLVESAFENNCFFPGVETSEKQITRDVYRLRFARPVNRAVEYLDDWIQALEAKVTPLPTFIAD